MGHVGDVLGSHGELLSGEDLFAGLDLHVVDDAGGGPLFLSGFVEGFPFKSRELHVEHAEASSCVDIGHEHFLALHIHLHLLDLLLVGDEGLLLGDSFGFLSFLLLLSLGDQGVDEGERGVELFGPFSHLFSVHSVFVLNDSVLSHELTFV